MLIREVFCRSIISKSNLPDAEYVINPYTGCSHACVYCYARFMKRFSGHDEPWGSFVDVKVNAPELVPKAAAKYAGRTFFLSSVTDPYLPLERKYGLTRRILERLVSLRPDLDIQSKSDLITRDIDILKRFPSCRVGLTITALDDTIRRTLEPGTASVERRIRALKALKEAGLKTYVFVGPILPYITDWTGIIKATCRYADSYIFENLNVRGSIRRDTWTWIGRQRPDLLERYEEIYKKGSTYWSAVEEEISGYCRDNGISAAIYFHHGEAPKGTDGERTKNSGGVSLWKVPD